MLQFWPPPLINSPLDNTVLSEDQAPANHVLLPGGDRYVLPVELFPGVVT